MAYFWIGIAILVPVAAGFLGLRWLDKRNDAALWQQLTKKANEFAGSYDPRTIEGLPEPARRYFEFSIAPGSPIVSAVELDMFGELALGSGDNPKFSPMTARQLLAPPHGLVWCVHSGALSGSDGVMSSSSWTRFWLAGFIPIVRVGANSNHLRSAFGRVVAECAIWTPAVLLPSDTVRWEAVDDNTARAIVSNGRFEQNVDVTVAQNGQPTHVVIARWSNENRNRVYQLQPFGGYLAEFQRFDGYMLPTSVEGGNHFGAAQYFPFYKVKVTKIRLVTA